MNPETTKLADDTIIALHAAKELLDRDPMAAAVALQAILNRNPASDRAYRAMGRAMRLLDRSAAAAHAELAAIDASTQKPEMIAGARFLKMDRLAEAEKIARQILRDEPDDVAAICLLAEVATRVGIYAEAAKLLERALTLAPTFIEAKAHLARVFFQQNQVGAAIGLLDEVLAVHPNDRSAQSLKLIMLGQTGEYQRAIECYEQLFPEHLNDARFWNDYGNVLKTVGRTSDGVAAYRKAIEIDPGLGESWWALANLKTVRFDDHDIATMETELTTKLDHNRALHLHFALGKALEDTCRYEKSFRHYESGNEIRRRSLPYDAAFIAAEVQRSIEFFTSERMAAFDHVGAQSDEPIFIVGMPRSGSTLIEQILASHPLIEGTSELADIPLLVQRLLADRWQDRSLSYPSVIEQLPVDEFSSLGEAYLRAAKLHRKTDRPFFIDKLPNNWAYVGFIRLILPNAKIIDARRNPMACCFSNFKQHYAQGQPFSYSQTDMGDYYRNYTQLMAQLDQAMPGHIHTLHHEDLIDDPEREVRRLFDYLGLPFDAACLRFHENDRAVRTASSEQVRRPINRDAVDQWKNYEPWLDELKTALGPLANR